MSRKSNHNRKIARLGAVDVMRDVLTNADNVVLRPLCRLIVAQAANPTPVSDLEIRQEAHDLFMQMSEEVKLGEDASSAEDMFFSFISALKAGGLRLCCYDVEQGVSDDFTNPTRVGIYAIADILRLLRSGELVLPQQLALPQKEESAAAE